MSDGEYTLGSDDEDDIQIFDVSLKAGHARLVIQSGNIEIAGGAGQLTTKNGLVLQPGGARQALEPLDVVSAGTTRFALGARSANWASITDEKSDGSSGPGADAVRAKEKPGLYARLRKNRWRVAAAAAIILVASAGVLPFLGGTMPQNTGSVVSTKNQLALVKSAVAALPFPHDIDVRQDVDGAIYVTGYVERPVYRRAVLNSIRKTGVAARVRVPVLEQIRNETANLLEAEKADLTFKLSDKGVLTLNGVIFDDARANSLIDLVRERVDGLAGVVSGIRTGPSLLADVVSLADKSKIRPWVQLRFDRDVVEATGILPKEKIDAWAGFLQAYSTDFSAVVPLRSFVRLQGSDASSPGALVLGRLPPRQGDKSLDVSKLRDGSFKLGDVFLGDPEGRGKPKPGKPPGAAQVADGQKPPAVHRERPRLDLQALLKMDRNGREADPIVAVVKRAAAIPRPLPPGGLYEDGLAPLTSMARRLFELWHEGKLSETKEGKLIEKGLAALDRQLPGTANAHQMEKYSMLLAKSPSPANGRPCWQDSQLTTNSVVASVFWLDLLSVNSGLSIADFPRPSQAILLDAALNPDWTRECAQRAAGAMVSSVYLNEIARNTSFIGFIARDMHPFDVDVSGASIVGDRYVLTRDGRRLREGAALDDRDRLILVGELGAVFENSQGYSIRLFESKIDWLVR